MAGTLTSSLKIKRHLHHKRYNLDELDRRQREQHVLCFTPSPQVYYIVQLSEEEKESKPEHAYSFPY